MSDSDLHSTLRAKGYRLTPQRQLVLDAVTELEHGTPDEICASVQQRSGGVNLSTVYRTLELLEQLGLVTHTHLGHGAPTYHSAGRSNHLHLVCHDCGAVMEAEASLADPLMQDIADKHGFETDLAHFAIYGRCRKCAT